VGLDFHLIHSEPAALYMGELPRRWQQTPAPVVVNLCGMFPMGNPIGRVVFGLPMLDLQDPDAVPDRGEVESFLGAVHEHCEAGASYWHCHAGINRSGFGVCAYLHRHRGLSISDAIGLVRSRRDPMVLCNAVFEQTLRKWYGGPSEQDFEPVTMEAYLAARQGR